ncbi:MAG TPA: Hpt domain-containing protein [Bacteroidia bacterium]|nr:Hpt domain-containing protein [Bacteroidia bacterium]
MEDSIQFEKPDLSYLMQLMDNNSEIVLEVLSIFKSEVPKDMHNLNTHLNNNEWEMLGKTAHKLKSSVGNLGLNQLKDLFLYIEQNGKESTNIEQLPKYVNIVVRGIEQLFIDLEVEILRLQKSK